MQKGSNANTRGLFGIIAIVATSALLSCTPAEVKNDPFRAEFVEACMGRIEYQSMKPKKRASYCKCGYDKTISGLTDEEMQFARFYLLGQVGIDVRSRKLIEKPNAEAMMAASKAIGEAIKRCKQLRPWM